MTDVDLDAQVARWRSFVTRRQAIAPADVDELEDHLRGQVEDLRATGLSAEEAFLIAIGRLGNLDAVSREFAREHSERLWKQLALVPRDAETGTAPAWRDLAVALGCAVGAGAAIKAGGTWIHPEEAFVRNAPLLVMPFVATYLAWQRRVSTKVYGVLLLGFVALALVLNLYPYAVPGSTGPLAALHAPVLMWLLVGVAYVAGQWRSDSRRMDAVRFTGELAIYYTLLAIGGGVLTGLTGGVLSLLGADVEKVLGNWVMPFAVPGAFLVAVWLVEAKKSVVENLAPVLTKVFTPLTILMLLAVLVVLAASGDLSHVDRQALIVMDAILILVECLLLYAISARDPLARVGLFDVLQLVLVVVALLVDAVMLAAMVSRIAEFGSSPNKLATLGVNLLLLVHLAVTAWLELAFLRGRRPFATVERWQTRYLLVYGAWALLVVVGFGPIFRFA